MKNDASTISLRLPEETKARWSREAKEKKKSLSEWIIEMVDGGFSSQKYEWDGLLRDCIENWYYDEFVLAKRESEMEMPGLEEFIISACDDKLYTLRCPHCGKMVPGNRKFCCDCGEKLKEWESPEDAAAIWFYQRFTKGRKPKYSDGKNMQFQLISVTNKMRSGTYQIVELAGPNGIYQPLHTITREELNEAKKMMREEEEE